MGKHAAGGRECGEGVLVVLVVLVGICVTSCVTAIQELMQIKSETVLDQVGKHILGLGLFCSQSFRVVPHISFPFPLFETGEPSTNFVTSSFSPPKSPCASI